MAKRHAASTATPTLETPLPTTQSGQVAAPFPTQTPPAAAASATPPTPPAAPVATQPAKKKHGCLGCCLILLVVFVFFCLAVVGVFFAYRGGYINVFQIKNSLGMGYGEASVTDMLNGPMTATITPLDTDSANILTDQIDLKKYEISSFRALDPGRYTITFTDSTGASLGSCTLSAKSGDEYQFVAVPSGIAITKKGYDPTQVKELNILTSSLCQS